jgi:hypothetical protein
VKNLGTKNCPLLASSFNLFQGIMMNCGFGFRVLGKTWAPRIVHFLLPPLTFFLFGGGFFSSDNWNQRFGSKHPAYTGVERYLHAAFFKSLLV